MHILSSYWTLKFGEAEGLSSDPVTSEPPALAKRLAALCTWVQSLGVEFLAVWG